VAKVIYLQVVKRGLYLGSHLGKALVYFGVFGGENRR
jgi:hypothetical protein